MKAFWVACLTVPLLAGCTFSNKMAPAAQVDAVPFPPPAQAPSQVQAQAPPAVAPPAEPPPRTMQMPADYRQQIVRFAAENFQDPRGVRNAQISNPLPISVGSRNGGSAPGVCLMLDTRNAAGEYLGLQILVAAFKNGKIAAVGDPIGPDCVNATFEPFPEIEQIS